MMNAEPSAQTRAAQGLLWKRSCRLTAALLMIWLLLITASLFFARELAGIQIFGWNLSFYLAAQGLTLSFVMLVGIYAIAMRALVRRFPPHGEPR